MKGSIKKTIIFILFISIVCSVKSVFAVTKMQEDFAAVVNNLDKEEIENAKSKLLNSNLDKIEVGGIILYKDVSKVKYDKIAMSVNVQLKVLTAWAYNEKDDLYNIPIKAIACSPNTKRTPRGLFYPENFLKGFHEMYGDSNYCQYCVRIHNQFLLHSPLFEKRNHYTLKVDSYNSLGKKDSGGCVRVTTGDAAWFYEKLDKKSPIYIYDSEYRGPLAAETIARVDTDQKYDPTDPFIINEYENEGKEVETLAKTDVVPDTAEVEEIELETVETKEVIPYGVRIWGSHVEKKEKEATENEIEKNVTTKSEITTKSIISEETTTGENETQNIETETTNESETSSQGYEETTIIAPVADEEIIYEIEPEGDF